MTKELEALERIRSHNYHELPKRECLRIIETALKNYQEGLDNAQTYVKHTSKQALYDLLGLAIKNVHPSYWKLPEQLFEDVNKSIKALEIIKETLPIEENDFYYDEELDKYFFIGSVVSKDKYDFLKEVLL